MTCREGVISQGGTLKMEGAPVAPAYMEAMPGGNKPTRFMLTLSDGDADLHPQ